MRSRTAYILTAALPVLCAIACKKETADMPGTPDISFGFHVSDGPGSKALLEEDDLFTTGTRMKVYGFATADIPGHLSDGTAGTSKLNDGQTLEFGSSGQWSFTGDETYRWLDNGTHTFLGWLDTDAKPTTDLTASGFFGTGFSFDASTRKLSVPTKEMGISAGNFDFAYSDIATRSAAEADYSTVELTLNHLFASFGLSAINYSTQTVTIKKIVLHGLMDKKSATVDFSGTSTSVSYTGGNVSNHTLYDNTTGLSLAAAGSTGDMKANVVGTTGDSPVYFLVWPQTAEEMTYGGTKDTQGLLTPGPSDTSEPYLEISYTQGGDDITAYAAIPHDSDAGWAPGIRHQMELSFRDREIDLGLQGAPWDKLSSEIDYSGMVTVDTKLQLASAYVGNCVLSADGETAYFKPGVPIILEFTIATPLNATWIVNKKLDMDAFDVYNYPDGARKSPDDEVKAEGTIDGNMVTIAIAPPTRDLQKTEFSLELSISVLLNNGDMVTLKPEDIYAEGCPRKFVYIKQ